VKERESKLFREQFINVKFSFGRIEFRGKLNRNNATKALEDIYLNIDDNSFCDGLSFVCDSMDKLSDYAELADKDEEAYTAAYAEQSITLNPGPIGRAKTVTLATINDLGPIEGPVVMITKKNGTRVSLVNNKFPL